MTLDRAIEIFKACLTPSESGSDAATEDEFKQAIIHAITAMNFLKMMRDTPTCNTCDVSVFCKYVPAWGKQVRYNCPHYISLKKGDE